MLLHSLGDQLERILEQVLVLLSSLGYLGYHFSILAGCPHVFMSDVHDLVEGALVPCLQLLVLLGDTEALLLQLGSLLFVIMLDSLQSLVFVD